MPETIVKMPVVDRDGLGLDAATLQQSRIAAMDCVDTAYVNVVIGDHLLKVRREGLTRSCPLPFNHQPYQLFLAC